MTSYGEFSPSCQDWMSAGARAVFARCMFVSRSCVYSRTRIAIFWGPRICFVICKLTHFHVHVCCMTSINMIKMYVITRTAYSTIHPGQWNYGNGIHCKSRVKLADFGGLLNEFFNIKAVLAIIIFRKLK